MLKSVCVVIFFSSCKNEIDDIRALTDAQHKPVQTSYNATYTFTEKGMLRQKLTAARIDQYKGDADYIEANGGFQLCFYDSLQNEEAQLIAEHGIYTENDKRFVAEKNVVLRNIKGEKLETEQLIFETDSSRIYTDKFVVITLENGSVIRGNGLESNDAFTRYRIIHPTGELYMDQQNPTNASTK
ncbi:MAG: LPS export ABC transporter periplasmic protein LptC [Flavobacteriales bacterium]